MRGAPGEDSRDSAARRGHNRAMRKALLLVAFLAAMALLPRIGWAQKPERMSIVGVILPGTQTVRQDRLPKAEFFTAFLDSLAKRGYVEGKNLAIQLRVGPYERLPELARELEQQRVAGIWVGGTRAARIVQEVVKRTPLVIYSCDPFEHVTSLRLPTGNVTGTTCMTTELSPKRLGLLKELLPTAKRVVFFGDPDDAPQGWRLTREAAQGLGISIQLVAYKDREDIPAALDKVAQAKPDAVFVYPDAILVNEARRLADFWLAHSLPSMNAFPHFSEAGGLMSYGAIDGEVSSMMGGQMAAILDGTPPGKVPVQQATRFQLVINKKTAKALNVKVPESLLLRADRVIDTAPPQ